MGTGRGAKQQAAKRGAAPRRRTLLIGAAAALVLLAAAGGALWYATRGDAAPRTLRAVVVDQLAQTDKNPAFISGTIDTLKSAGYVVDYVPPEQVTVEFYRTLPTKHYDLVILRSHSTSDRTSVDTATGAVTKSHLVALFTNEVYSTSSYTDEQRANQLAKAYYPTDPQGTRYFSIDPDFLRVAAAGRFAGSTIVLMGCAGLSTDTMASAFRDKGAATFISWDAEVTAAHTDKAAEALVRHLVTDRLPAAEAVAKTMAEVGPDPQFGAKLLAYP